MFNGVLFCVSLFWHFCSFCSQIIFLYYVLNYYHILPLSLTSAFIAAPSAWSLQELLLPSICPGRSVGLPFGTSFHYSGLGVLFIEFIPFFFLVHFLIFLKNILKKFWEDLLRRLTLCKVLLWHHACFIVCLCGILHSQLWRHCFVVVWCPEWLL